MADVTVKIEIDYRDSGEDPSVVAAAVRDSVDTVIREKKLEVTSISVLWQQPEDGGYIVFD